jgi:hypothetical protein
MIDGIARAFHWEMGGRFKVKLKGYLLCFGKGLGLTGAFVLRGSA